MSFRSVAAMTVVLVFVTLTTASFIRAQSLNLRLPDETAGVDAIARTLISAFDQFDIVALGEAHGRFRVDSDLRIAMVRHPDFPKKVRNIVVEFGSTTEQSTLDRYIRGENDQEPSWSRSGRLQPRPPTASGTNQFTQTFSQPSATSIQSCLLTREFASSAATRDRETTVAVRPQPSQF